MKLSLCIHCHQPVGNFDDVISGAWSSAYLPLLESLERHPSIRIGMHLSGCLIEWFGENIPEALDLVAGLCRRGSLELLTSGYFEPVLPVWDRDDIIRQITCFSDLIQGLSGSRPSGLWLTERVWEPSLASLIADAGISYAVVDDLHLLWGGVPATELYRPWMTEDSGKPLVLLPSSRKLRYLIPFSPVERVRDQLRQWHDSGRELAFYGDDGEKFGVWPGTAELCHERGWLDSFFDFLQGADWIDVITPSEAVASTRASGPVYVPTTSYREMGEWTLPTEDQKRLENLSQSLLNAGLMEAAEDYLRGGMWRNFLSRYPESAELHGRVIHSREWVYGSGDEDAMLHFWRSQCNCAYWHGVFGGIYLPHLREAVWRELHLAESKALGMTHALPFVVEDDVDADGHPELLVLGGEKSFLVRPGTGLTVSEFSFVPGDGGTPVPLGHVLSRRPEAYHTRSSTSPVCETTGSIHDPLPDPEGDTALHPGYDSWRRICFSDIVLPPGTGKEDWLSAGSRVLHFQDSFPIRWQWTRTDDAVAAEALLGKGEFTVDKEMRIPLGEPGISVRSLFSRPRGEEFRAGLELCLNLLSGEGPERSIVIGDSPPVPAGSTGASCEPVKRIKVRDLWRGIEVLITSSQPVDVWYAPVESLSRSEKGFEKVYQGTALYFSKQTGEENSVTVCLDVRIGRPDSG